MTKLESVRCNRCQKIFTVEKDEEPEGIVINAFRESRVIDMCDDCSATVAFMMKYVKEFDDLASIIAKEESGE
jgi:hypothetical protein